MVGRVFYILAVISTLVSACATTPYREQGTANRILFGYTGFKDTELAKGVLRVVVTVPGHTPRKRIRRMVFLYAAERTIEKGFEKFALTNRQPIKRKEFESEKVRAEFFEGKFGVPLGGYSQVRLDSQIGFVAGSGSYASTVFVFMLSDAEARKVVSHSAREVIKEIRPLVVKGRQEARR